MSFLFFKGVKINLSSSKCSKNTGWSEAFLGCLELLSWTLELLSVQAIYKLIYLKETSSGLHMPIMNCELGTLRDVVAKVKDLGLVCHISPEAQAYFLQEVPLMIVLGPTESGRGQDTHDRWVQASR